MAVTDTDLNEAGAVLAAAVAGRQGWYREDARTVLWWPHGEGLLQVGPPFAMLRCQPNVYQRSEDGGRHRVVWELSVLYHQPDGTRVPAYVTQHTDLDKAIRHAEQFTSGPLTVARLRDQLAGMPDDALVIVAKDEEGNGFSPLASVDGDGAYFPETSWQGAVHELNSECDTGGGLPAVVLWPTN